MRIDCLRVPNADMKTYNTQELRELAEDFVAEMESYGESYKISHMLNFVDWLDGYEDEHYDDETKLAMDSEMLRSCEDCGDFYTNEDSHPCFNI